MLQVYQTDAGRLPLGTLHALEGGGYAVARLDKDGVVIVVYAADGRFDNEIWYGVERVPQEEAEIIAAEQLDEYLTAEDDEGADD